jgi:hypothetical protein
MAWFHEDVLGRTDAEVRFIKGRLRFGDPSGARLQSNAPFPSMVIVWRPGGDG